MAMRLKVPWRKVLGVHPELLFLTEPGTPRPEFQRHRERIADSMRERGWVGRPLLGHARDDGMVQAWQGMHRLAAAADAGVEEIPMLVMSIKELLAAGFTEAELAAAPWEKTEALLAVPDVTVRALVQLELTETPKRGF